MVIADEKDSHCARVDMGKSGPYRMPLAGPVEDPESMAYLADFPREDRRTAQAGGLEPLLVAILREKEKAGDAPTLPLLAMQQELRGSLGSVHVPSSALVAPTLEEIVGPCEGLSAGPLQAVAVIAPASEREKSHWVRIMSSVPP